MKEIKTKKYKLYCYKLYYFDDIYLIYDGILLNKFVFKNISECKNLSEIIEKCFTPIHNNADEDYLENYGPNLHLLGNYKLLFDVVYDILKRNKLKPEVNTFLSNYCQELLI